MPIDLNHLLTEELQINRDACKNQVVVITGAGQGIGLHTARAFAYLGAEVIIAELTENGREAEHLICSEGGKAAFFQMDVSDPESVNRLSSFLKDSFGSVSILINNAIFIEGSSVSKMPLEAWDRTIAVNLRGTFLTCQAFLPGMIHQNYGIIINMISTDAMPGLSAYIASKQGILGFTQSLAQEVQGSGIKVVPFGPGMVDTPGIRKVAPCLTPLLGITEETFLNLSMHQAYEGLMPPEHAAAATVYLALFHSEEFHGQEVTGYEILEKAGLLEIELPQINDLELINEENQQKLIKRILTILEDTEKEFGKLPAFVRPLAKKGFKNKSGMSITDWLASFKNFQSAQAKFPTKLKNGLDGLIRYYQEVPQEMARFTRDKAVLQEIVNLSEERVRTIKSFQQTFE